MDFSSWIPVILFLCMAACVIHVVRHGNPLWWVLILLFFPVFGVLLYFFVEILPGWRGGPRANDWSALRQRMQTPGSRIRQLQKSIAATPTIEKKVELAEAMIADDRIDEAVQLYEACASGPFDDDPFILFGYANALFRKEDYQRSAEILQQIDATRSRDKLPERRLLRLRILEKTGQETEALREYPKLLESFSGEEARFRYGCLLAEQGHTDEAKEQLQRIAKAHENHSRLYRRQNEAWIKAARHLLKNSLAK